MIKTRSRCKLVKHYLKFSFDNKGVVTKVTLNKRIIHLLWFISRYSLNCSGKFLRIKQLLTQKIMKIRKILSRFGFLWWDFSTEIPARIEIAHIVSNGHYRLQLSHCRGSSAESQLRGMSNTTIDWSEFILRSSFLWLWIIQKWQNLELQKHLFFIQSLRGYMKAR